MEDTLLLIKMVQTENDTLRDAVGINHGEALRYTPNAFTSSGSID